VGEHAGDYLPGVAPYLGRNKAERKYGIIVDPYSHKNQYIYEYYDVNALQLLFSLLPDVKEVLTMITAEGFCGKCRIRSGPVRGNETNWIIMMKKSVSRFESADARVSLADKNLFMRP
jgi:hypothetical protein